jgi:hypothetical protein
LGNDNHAKMFRGQNETVKGEAIGASSVAEMISLRRARRRICGAQAPGASSWALLAGVLFSVAGQHRFSERVRVKAAGEVISFG